MQKQQQKAGRLVRKQLLLTKEQNNRLKALAAARSRTEGDLVREAVDGWLARQDESERDWKSAWRQAAGMWKNRTDLDELFSSMRAGWDRAPLIARKGVRSR